MGHEHPDPAVCHHVAKALRRERGIERYVRPARFEDSEQPHDHVQGALHQQPDTHVRAHPTLAEMMCQLGGAPVQLPIGQRLALRHHRHLIGCAPSLLLDQLMHTPARSGPYHRGVVPVHQQLPALLRGKERQPDKGLVRLARDGFQQPRIASAQRPHRLGVEQIRAVLDHAVEATLGFGDQEGQVELGRAGLELSVAGHLRNLRDARRVMEDEHDLEQGCAARVALWRQFSHEVIQRQVGMRERAERPCANLPQQRAEAHIFGEPGAQHHGVEEAADQALGFAVGPARDRRPDEQVVLTGVAVQQGRETGLQHHEERGLLFAPQCLHALEQLLRHLEPLARAPEALRRRPGLVRDQLQRGGGARELFLPVGDLLLQHGAA